VALLAPLDPDERSTFLVVSVPLGTLRKLVGRLGVAAPGARLDTLSEWQCADALVDYYEEDTEVAQAVDRTLRKQLGNSPLADAVGSAAGARGVTDLVLSSADPARDLAWALLAHGPAETGELAARLVRTILEECQEEEPAPAEDAAPAPSPEPAAVAREVVKEAARARSARERALKRLGTVKEQLVDLEQRLASARREQRAEQRGREDAEKERDRLAEECRALRTRIETGTSGEVARLGRELDAAERRLHALEDELEAARSAETSLAARLREAEQGHPAPARTGPAPAAPVRGPGSAATWSLPVFTDEFYDSIRRWDRKVVRTAFDKIVRLAEDWRHPSLRAIPLEGLPDHYRIRIASDVRLIYRPIDGGRLEILSLIDREDLSRYVRTAKTR
jgi:hypothetical protein